MSGHRAFRVLTALLLAAGLGAGAGCAPGGGTGPAPGEQGPAQEPVGRSEPANGSPFWVDPNSDAARQVTAYQAQGRTEDAKVLRRISERPAAVWPAWNNHVADIHRAVRGAASAKRTVVLVAYNIPHRDCGMYSKGGAESAEAYRTWIGSFAEAIGDAPAIVVLEPDAVPHLVDGCTPAQHHDERYQLLAEAVDRLKRQPRTKVYLDAGNPAWLKDPGKLVEPLRRAGAARADGFSLNVSNFQTTESVTAFGTELSALLGGAHFVIDTSRNGAGPLAGDGEEAWCNPPGRALGTPPTEDTGDERLDAYLWVKRPGESDGTCRGGPAAGTWWPEYALGLARRAKA
ncbi:glycoside hydrolase family 6 protein [Streptomyces ficellus]|uniref:Glucanase n=1 Tax=Streptomyces ficellus TaxID=1977088 RepID=A0ABT7Z4N7_9ACTN|nr:glycoside hydrolase family 6 protein [Streptomyces ficellus]MDN3294443.1 glycoside hydrolase family 6 protein [Streptomyces ficellus]